MVTEHERRDELAEALATQLAALVRRAMHDNNDFTLPEPVVEKLGLELGVQVGVGVPGWYEPENITRFGQRFVKAVGWSLRWPGQNQKVARAVGQVLDQLHDVLGGNLNATNTGQAARLHLGPRSRTSASP